MKQALLLAHILFFLVQAPLVKGTPMSLNILTQNTTCGYNMGRMSILVTGGAAPYSYSINDISQPNNHIVSNNGYYPLLRPGTYAVLVTDANGQTATGTATISNTLGVINASKSTETNVSCASGKDGSVTIKATGGTPPYTYSIDYYNFQADSTFRGLAIGAYDFFIKDANGCISDYNTWVRSYNCNTGFALAYSGSVCDMDNASLEIGVPIIGRSYRFSLDSMHWQSSNDFYNLSSGVYYIYIQDITTGIVSTLGMQILKQCQPVISSISIDASCQQSDGGFTIKAVHGTPPYTYTMDGINYQTDSSFTGLAAGTYYVSVKDANGYITSGTATVYNKCPVVIAAETDDICGRGNGTVTAHGAKGNRPYQFSINGGGFQADSVFSGLSAGNYTVVLKDANGFMTSAAATVNKNCLSVTAATVSETCGKKNGGITATGSNGTLPYTFSLDGINFQVANVFSGLSAGAYILTLKDANLLTTTANVTVANIPGPSVNLGNDTTMCSGQILALALNIPNASYIWQDGSTGNSFIVSKAGKYWATATANGCSGSDTINVSYLNLGKIFTTSDTTACTGNTITLNAGHAGATFIWDDNGNKQTRKINADGKYWVKVSSSGCSISDTITCHFASRPIIVFPSDTSFCNTQQLILNAGNINATYLWNDGTVGSTLVVKKAGTYIVAATANGCTTYDTIKVAIKPNPQIALGNDTTLCTGEMVTLNATARNPIGSTTYFWQDGTTQPIYLVDKKGNYSVKVEANGCDTTGKITISYNSKPIVDIGADTTLCNTNQLILDATYPQSAYLWQDGSIGPNFTVIKAGSYVVDVTNNCGSVKDSINIQYENCACQFYISSAFSPNGDGKNDVFKPSYKCFFTGFRLDVFNRLGKVIFTSSDAARGWDGSTNGQQQASGVYVWEISYTDTLTGKAIKKTGTVVLVR